MSNVQILTDLCILIRPPACSKFLIMATETEQVSIPIVYRITELWHNQSTAPVLVVIGAVLVSYLIYNVRRLSYLPASNSGS